MKRTYNGKVIIESAGGGALIKSSGCLATNTKVPRNPQKKFRKQLFCRHDNIICLM